jgi:hypothetical protein
MKPIGSYLIPLFGLSVLPMAGAAILSVETFDTNGPIANQNGGTGWNWNNLTQSATVGKSDWDLQFGSNGASTGGQLVLTDSGAKREFNGPTEGTGTTDEDKGAFRGTGRFFVAFDMSRSATAGWSGLSSFDFNNERFFFGVPTAGIGTDTIGIDVNGGGASTMGSISLVDNQMYTLVAVIDFDNDLLGLYVNPDGTDTWDAMGGTADVTRAYTGTQWSTALRLGSDNVSAFIDGVATFDNLKVATSFSDLVAPVPEPSTALLGTMALGFLRRRRR